MRYTAFLLLLTLSTQPLAARQECLGRLSFLMPEHFEWATGRANIPMGSSASFSELMAMPADNWDYNRNVKIIVSQPTTKYYFTDQWRAFMPGYEALRMQRDLVDSWKRIIENRKKSRQRQKEMIAKGEFVSRENRILKLDIDEAKERFKKAEDELYAMENHSVPWVKLATSDARTISYDNQ